jgi:glycerate 2-kinase
MRVLIAADKFKGSLTAPEACDAIAAGVRGVRPDAVIDLCPMSDGGEGFVDAMTRSRNGRRVTRTVTGPLPELRVDATFAVVDGEKPGDTAVIEMSSASGLALLAPAERNPLYTTTFGTGELIRFAVEMECRRILLGIGGSATCDAGLGCLQACGCHVILNSQQYAPMSEPLCARDLDDVLLIKTHRGSRVDGVEMVIACDVTNPLYGPTGSAAVYGPQKGASPDDVRTLDRMLEAFATRMKWTDLARQPGSGAAGGIGFGLAAVFGATLRRGVELVIDATNLTQRVADADLVITGEGRLDAGSAFGKTTAGVAEVARRAGKPVYAIAGTISGDADTSGFTKAVALVDEATSIESAMRHAAELVAKRAARLL